MKTQINTLFRGLSLLYVALLIYAVFAIEWRWRYDITEIRSVLNWIPMYNKVKNWPKGQLFSIKFNEFYLDLFGNIMLFVPFRFFCFSSSESVRLKNKLHLLQEQVYSSKSINIGGVPVLRTSMTLS